MFKPGKEKTGGRKAGVPNVLTRTVRETVLLAFNELQKDAQHNIVAFARKNPRDFYQIASKLIPTEIKADVNFPDPIKIVYAADPNCKPIGTNPESDAGILGEQGSL